MKSSFAVLAMTVLSACSASGVSRGGSVVVDDSVTGQSLAHFSYTGSWEHITGRHDGRYNGTSSRSRRSGDSAVVPFTGSIVRVFGVRGPNGGAAAVGIDGNYYGTASFFARRKEAHVLVFQSPPLPERTHTLAIVVQWDPGDAHHAYVNIDDVEVLHAQ